MTGYNGADASEFDETQPGNWSDSFSPEANAFLFAQSHGSPANLDELVLQVQWLAHRVQVLEGALARRQAPMGLHNLRHLSYHIDKLYVKELSGTLNIGVSSNGGDHGLDGFGASAGAPHALETNGLLEQFGYPRAASHTADTGTHGQIGHNGYAGWEGSVGDGGVYEDLDDDEDWI